MAKKANARRGRGGAAGRGAGEHAEPPGGAKPRSSEDFPRLDYLRFWQREAQELTTSREKALVVHGTRDIDAAGDEVEMAARRVLIKSLPNKYHVGHGHLIDYRERVSPQLDVVVADRQNCPVFFTTENKTEYFLYESAYAVGEVKSTYYKSKNPVSEFCEVIAKIKAGLYRVRTPFFPAPPTEEQTARLAAEAPYYDIGSLYRNALFTFMLFAHSGDFAAEQVEDLYKTRPAADLPSAICFLDRGVLVNAHFLPTDQGRVPVNVNAIPEFNNKTGRPEHFWTLMQVGDKDYEHGCNLAFFYYLLYQHLAECVLSPPNMTAYSMRLLAPRAGVIFT